ncbi:TolB family protein [Prochlorococcus sp. MIT 1300]|uniref:TolB family protein n=1 Tax=Prochlorococcus sp. MIT 1300 TaxID=3096218 RepID=UPI0039BFAC49
MNFAAFVGISTIACLLGLAGCSNRVISTSSGLFDRSEQEPALSGDGQKMAVIVDQLGRPTVQLRDLRNGNLLDLKNLSRNQPHSSPSLSWNGRYLAVITQRGNKRVVVIQDRLTGRLHPLPLIGQRYPIRVSLAPDARQIALQVAVQGKWRIELFDLTKTLEPDEAAGLRLLTPQIERTQ